MLPGINQIIYISISDSDSNAYSDNYTYKARVADISNDFFSIEIPVDMKTGKFQLLHMGSTVKVSYISNEYGKIIFESKVLGLKREQIPLLMLENPTDFHRVQRRDYLRIPVSTEISLRHKEINSQWYVAKTLDLSGGGLQLILPGDIKIEREQEIEGWLVLPFKNGAIEHIKFEAKVIRVNLYIKESKLNSVSLKFTKIQELMREKIIRFCFQKQVELRKK